MRTVIFIIVLAALTACSTTRQPSTTSRIDDLINRQLDELEAESVAGDNTSFAYRAVTLDGKRVNLKYVDINGTWEDSPFAIGDTVYFNETLGYINRNGLGLRAIITEIKD